MLPVTKWQFEQFVTESGEIKKNQYQEMLALNPAVSLDQFKLDERERLFITGVWPEEALAFAAGWAKASTCLP